MLGGASGAVVRQSITRTGLSSRIQSSSRSGTDHISGQNDGEAVLHLGPSVAARVANRNPEIYAVRECVALEPNVRPIVGVETAFFAGIFVIVDGVLPLFGFLHGFAARREPVKR